MKETFVITKIALYLSIEAQSLFSEKVWAKRKDNTLV
jgi:hypothetical protein